jgi:pimeloyl-[acyl-carrier protein] methyl ester esterase
LAERFKMQSMEQSHFVLLPGLDGTGQLFAPLLESLPQKFKAAVVSYPTDKLLNYQQLIPHIREVMPWHVPYTLIAESFSGPLALLFAAAQPQDLQAIVLCASFIRNPLPRLLDWARRWVNDSWFRISPPRVLLKKFLAGDDCPAPLLMGLEQAIRSVRPEVLAHRVRLLTETNVENELRSCSKPILYLSAAQDQLVGQRGLEAIRAVKPNVVSRTLDAPHLLLQRKPAEALIAIQNFLQHNQARAAAA